MPTLAMPYRLAHLSVLEFDYVGFTLAWVH